MAQRRQPERRVTFVDSPQQTPLRKGKGNPTGLTITMDLVKRGNDRPMEGHNNTGRRRHQHPAEREQFPHQAYRQKAQTSKLEEHLANQNSQRKQGRRYVNQQDQASSQTQAPGKPWAKAGKGQDKVRERPVQRVEQPAAETQTVAMTQDHVMPSQNEVQEQLSQRDDEIARLRLENDRLSAMLEATNLQGENEQKEMEPLQMEIQAMEEKHKKLQEDYANLQEAKNIAEEKANKLEERIYLMLNNKKDQVLYMDGYIRKLLAEKSCFIDQTHQSNIRIRSLEDELLQNSWLASEMTANIESLKELLSVKENELRRISDVNQDLCEKLSTTEEKLVELQLLTAEEKLVELQTRETAWKTEHDTIEQLRKDLALREQEKEEMLQKQKQTEDSNILLQERIREYEEKNQELQELCLRKKNEFKSKSQASDTPDDESVQVQALSSRLSQLGRKSSPTFNLEDSHFNNDHSRDSINMVASGLDI
nr:PREDICTED: myosin-11-like [Stegastes partitus]